MEVDDVHVDGRSSHVSEHEQASLPLLAQHAFEEHQQQQREHTVVPVVIQTP